MLGNSTVEVVKVETQTIVYSRLKIPDAKVYSPVVSDELAHFEEWMHHGWAKIEIEPPPPTPCRLCGHVHTSRCKERAPNAQFTCACPGECAHGKHPAYCRECAGH